MADQNLEILKGTAEKAAWKIKIDPRDYLVDGILYCYKCNTPKQCRVEYGGESFTTMCLCKCEEERVDKENAERLRQERQARAMRLREAGFAEKRMTFWTFEADDGTNKKLTTIAKNYCNNFRQMLNQGKGLLLFGGVGYGKTFAAACIANELIEQGYPVMITSITHIINQISGMYEKQHFIDGLNEYPLLILDDFGTEGDTPYRTEIATAIIDARYRAFLPLIVTTNLTADELKHPASVEKERIYSRLFEMCYPYEVKGDERRKKMLAKDFPALNKILTEENNEKI